MSAPGTSTTGRKYIPPGRRHLLEKSGDGANKKNENGPNMVSNNNYSNNSNNSNLNYSNHSNQGGNQQSTNNGGNQQSKNQAQSGYNRWNNLTNDDIINNSSSYGKNNNNNSSSDVRTNQSWHRRDGRRQFTEVEEIIFKSVKEKNTGINFESYNNIPVEISGNGYQTIKPIDNFQKTEGVHELLMKNVRKVNYSHPTPVQRHSIPIILAHRDLMACAQTGSGKTAAFLFPIISTMLNSPPPLLPHNTGNRGFAARNPPASPVCLVLSPTRELAIQIYEESRKFCFDTGIRTVVLYGGSDIKHQLIDVDKGTDICVATPGRLVDVIDRRKVQLCLIKYFVLDEADRMLDMGFAPQIRHIVEEKDMPLSHCGRQTVMFSATFPKEIQQLAKDFLQNYIFLTVGRVGSTNDFINQRLLYADEDQKLRLLRKELQQTLDGLTLIFVETKKGADMLEDTLVDTYPCVCIHGDRSQSEREEALKLFSTGKRPILVATDVAARGLDISNITHVINYDLPTNIDDYVHRIGRTGRAGNVGVATSFVNDKNRPVLKDLMALLTESQQDVPEWFEKMVVVCTSSRENQYNNRGRQGFGGRDVREITRDGDKNNTRNKNIKTIAIRSGGFQDDAW